jgi:DNA-binding CsgD family transcriptional regulator
MGKTMDRTQCTQKELEALELARQGLTWAQIAEKLGISIWTVASRLESARIRMKAKERQQ